jgi:hypothetical protein
MINKKYSLRFGKPFENELKEIDQKNCELYLSRDVEGHNNFSPIIAENIKILTKRLDQIAPSKITFNDISFRTILDDINTTTIAGLISKLRKIARVEFEYCALSIRFCRMFFESPFKIINVKFKGCQIIPEYKAIIMDCLKTNYKIQNVDIDDFPSSFDRNCIAVDGEIKSYLYRNRAQYLCRQAAIALIQIRKGRNKFFDLVDKSLVIYLAKMVYNNKNNAEWLNTVFEKELKSLTLIK